MSEATWIEQQKQNRLFRSGGQHSDAARMLEHSPTNRVLSVRQARIIPATRYIGQLMDIKCLGELCDMIEMAQMCVDAGSRKDFMKVAIEQWQGKVAAGRKFSVESLV